eukprot:CAMPEP_0113592620 /NCGR_PEP_ID=MMETSP0015_2-20120614/37950_1 /TAXON_ID=2838 /ORGANISM="Odontella" /LENGTH=163 /DNA_ID=CAMNT_0000499181 /DNA_START=36 /DNA_END=524 /DNA_ORIENTATION=- /assembly_acc=CAM_ASM_000160
MMDAMRTKESKAKRRNKLWEDRVVAAFDLSAAFEYLHSHNIVYRDTKPHNIGFDIRGDIKLFDFGLAKELDPGEANCHGEYKLTPKTGTLRYMAPENMLGRCYGFSADVYAFSVLLWEIMSLTKPYASYDVKLLMDMVAKRGFRPEINPSWSDPLRILLKRGW